MGRACSVPGCKTGYRSCKEKFSTFSFPENEQLKCKWINAIHRPRDFEVTKNTCVCILHFKESQIIRTVKKKNARIEDIVELERPRLTDDAVPSVFPNQPSYFTTDPPTKRKPPEDRRQSLVAREEAEFNDWCATDEIKDFSDFLSKFQSKIAPSTFDHKIYNDFILLFKVNTSLNNVPEIMCSVKIFCNLKVQVYFRNNCLPSSRFKGFLSKSNELKYWTAFGSLMSHVNAISPTDISSFANDIQALFEQMELILKLWTPSAENPSVVTESSKLTKLNFLLEQMKLLTFICPRYSSNLLLWASSICLSFPSAYLSIRNDGIITLPHPLHIKRLTGSLKSEVGLSNEQVKYQRSRSLGLCQVREPRE
nr:PREDICTED: uncharacterized protein LOC109035641 [Bemisia tabaci]